MTPTTPSRRSQCILHGAYHFNTVKDFDFEKVGVNSGRGVSGLV